MRQRIHIQFAPNFARQQTGIHACPRNRTIRNGDNIDIGAFEHPRAAHKFAQIRVGRRVQFNGNYLLTLAQLFPEQALRQRIDQFDALLFARLGFLGMRVAVQCFFCLCNVHRRCTAAAAQNTGALFCHFQQLRRKIHRIAFIKRPIVDDNRITGIRHQRQRDAGVLQFLCQLQHMPCAANTVKANRINVCARLYLVQQICRKTAVPREAVRLNRKRDNNKSLRILLLDICRCLF